MNPVFSISNQTTQKQPRTTQFSLTPIPKIFSPHSPTTIFMSFSSFLISNSHHNPPAPQLLKHKTIFSPSPARKKAIHNPQKTEVNPQLSRRRKN
jgi:hypothetical protein